MKSIAVIFFILISSSSIFAQNTTTPHKGVENKATTDGFALNAAAAPLPTSCISIKTSKIGVDLDQILTSAKCDECLDHLMVSWLEKFVLLQKNGYGYGQADSIAMTSASVAYKLCNSTEITQLNE